MNFNMFSPKTIITYLVDGTPTGIKTIELSGWIGKAIYIPRAKLKEAKERAEMKKPAIYFLFGEDENGSTKAYIGETTNLIARMNEHDSKKDFWNYLIAFVVSNNSLTHTEIKFLEAKSIEKAFKAQRYLLDNKKEQIPNDLPEWKVSEMEEFLENVNLLTSSLGCPIIEEIKVHKNDNKIYFCTGPEADAQGNYLSEGFLVLQGSKVRANLAPATGDRVKGLQKKLLNESVITIQDGGKSYIFTTDYLFKSPSAAAQLVLGRSANGWTEWFDKDKKTLDEIERKSLKN